MFNNQILEDWLDKRANEILSKLGNDNITDSEMLVLVLKAQTNHFNHLDGDLNNKICVVEKSINELDVNVNKRIDELDVKVNTRIDELDVKVNKRIDELDIKVNKRIDELDIKVNKRIDELDVKVNKRFEEFDKKFDQKIDSRFFWTLGIMITGFAGIYLKLFFK